MKDLDERSTSAEEQYAPLPLRAKLFRLVGQQSWIPRGRDRILRKIWDPDSGDSFPFVVDFFGLHYPGNLSEYIDWRVFAYGCAAPAELCLLAELSAELRKTKSRIAFFDVGANVGHHTLFMALHADDIFAFEPFPPLQEKIRQKLVLNQLSHVRVIPCALGATDRVQLYYPGKGSNSGTGSFVSEEIRAGSVGAELQIRNGDRLFSELDLPGIDLLKMDVEGFECEVVHGLAGRIHRDRPPILMELSELSRAAFGSEQNFKSCFWDGAVFAGVTSKAVRYSYGLEPLRFNGPNPTGEVLVVPPELSDFVSRRISS